jgi:hypothetical protein
MTKKHRLLLGIKGVDKREKQKQLASYRTKLLEDTLHEVELNVFATSTCSST